MSRPYRPENKLWHLATTPESPCVYLPERGHSLDVYALLDSHGDSFDDVLAKGFRRSGPVYYVPECPGGCRECVPVRVPVREFRMSRSQRRVWKRCADQVTARARPPRMKDEHHDLYNRHARHVSATAKVAERDDYEEFLCRPVGDTVQIEYLIDGRLAGVSTLDLGKQDVSSVYFFWDPDLASYGLGTYSALWEMEWCRERGFRYYYLGYWIRDCSSMSYKTRFRPYELMDWNTMKWRRECDDSRGDVGVERGTGGEPGSDAGAAS